MSAAASKRKMKSKMAKAKMAWQSSVKASEIKKRNEEK
jgi:hypothetical protein